MLKIDQLKYRYSKNKPLLENINLELTEGKIYGLLGKNGAGKSTILKNIIGILFPKEGTIELNQVSTAARIPATMAEFYIIPEQFEFPAINAKQYAKVNGSFYPRFNINQYNTILNDFKIPVDQDLNTLSHGQQKKAHLAFALALNTKWLLMDEPSNGLDIPSKSLFRKIIAQSLNEERGIIISSHQVKDIETLIDTIIVLEQGKIIFHQDLNSISEKLSFEKMKTSELDGLDVLYMEESIGSAELIMKNNFDEDSNVNLELLFNSIITDAEKINNVFNS